MRGEDTELVIGDGNTLRESCTISLGTAGGGGVTSVGTNNWIMASVHIAHDCVIGDHTILANNATLAGHVTLGDWVILGGMTAVHQFCARRRACPGCRRIDRAARRSAVRDLQWQSCRAAWHQLRRAEAPRFRCGNDQPVAARATGRCIAMG